MAWNTQVALEIMADPRLDETQKAIIEMEYQMTDGKRTIHSRAALLIYTLRKLGLDQFKNRAQAQQIILSSKSQEQIDRWLN